MKTAAVEDFIIIERPELKFVDANILSPVFLLHLHIPTCNHTKGVFINFLVEPTNVIATAVILYWRLQILIPAGQ